MAFRERLDGLSRGELTGLVVVVVATLLGAVLWYTRSLPRPVDIAAPANATSPVVSSGAAPFASLTPSPVAIIVDVAGWVRSPGVLRWHNLGRRCDENDGDSLRQRALCAPT